MKNKPSIFLEKMGKKSNHNQTVCYVEEKEEILKSEPIYIKEVWIETKEGSFKTAILEQNEKEIITADHKKIPIKEIKSLKRIS